jgi:hypothetical protein
MSQIVEINLRLPTLRIKGENGAKPTTIVNSDVRFTKDVELEKIPKPGEVLTMTAMSSGFEFNCQVIQSHWHHEKNAFVVACRLAKRSISPSEYYAITESPDWRTQPLL